MTQKYKGDALELKFDEAGKPAMAICGAALDDYYENAYSAQEFLLMLYDQGRMPFGSKIPRDDFVRFIIEAIPGFAVTGTFRMMIFLFKSLFGELTDIIFTVPAPGRLQVDVNASTLLEFNAIFVEQDGETGNIIDHTGNELVFSAVSGIDTQYEFNQIMSEIFPAGIYPEVTLSFFTQYQWIDDVGDNIVDTFGNNIVFVE